MKIKNLSCTQFAGIRDRDISFTDGVNVICGANESGKSTTANLIARTLFQNAKLDRRSGKDFIEKYLPCTRKGSTFAGDFADGKITFETENGTYTLSKEWCADARCTLSTPDGSVRDQARIDEILKEALLYGEGVYSDLLLSSQSNTDTALKTLLDAKEKSDAKTELTDVVSQAFAESDGISTDAIEQAIQKKIDDLTGKHWDIALEKPARKAGRWSSGLGEVLKAYYALEDANAVLDTISTLEAEADRAANYYADRDSDARAAEDAYQKFNAFASNLILQSERKKAVARVEAELGKIRSVLAQWPALEQALSQAKTLRTELANRDLLDKYEAARKIVDEINALDPNTANMPCPGDDEIKLVKTAQRKITTLENQLCGMNLTAAITMLGGNTVEVTSVRTGQTIDVSHGAAAINEAVKLVIPGVMEMQLAPANVDVAAIEGQIAENRRAVSDICAKYAVSSSETLEALARMITDARTKLEAANGRLKLLLGATTFEALEADAAAITAAPRTRAEITGDITALCGGSDIARFITARETVIDGYQAEYGGVNDLKIKAFDLDAELKRAQDSAATVENVPAEYASISDPEAYLAQLQSDLEQKRELREKALTAKTASASKLESYQENISGDPAADVERAARILDEQKALLAHWQHISQVFQQQKANLHANPMQDIADSFSRYLGIISDGRVYSEFPEANKLAMQVYSNDRLMDYSKLSEGTKETVSLAFRLAVLDHLFPNGGGVIVLDDPFTDMDPQRTAQGCRLIRECAQQHQVIFLTCREEYFDMLGGNHIRF